MRQDCHASSVLNAFRHQRKKRIDRLAATTQPRNRCSTPSGIKGRNALGRGTTGRAPKCSTPSGIKGRNTGRIEAELCGRGVLNAFRHQRKKRQERRYIAPLRCAQRLPASKEETPRRLEQQSRLGGTCSTPSGIKGRNAVHGRARRSTPPVLNAFRHQRKKRTGRLGTWRWS